MDAGRATSAVVLSGGGAYGAYEVGVMKALFNGESAATGYSALDAEVFTGTSVGALNAAFMTMQPGIDSASTVRELENVWANQMSDNPQTCGNGVYRFRGDPLRYFEPECLAANPSEPFTLFAQDVGFLAQYVLRRGANFLMSSGGLSQRLFQFVDLSALISIEPLRQSIRRIMRFDQIRRSDRALRIAATNWRTGELKVFENRDMTDELGPQIVQASAAIPGIFPPVEVAGETYVDGGAVNNTPLECAIQSGADVLHVIYVDPDISSIPMRRLQNTLDTFMKTFTIMLATIANEDIDHAREINLGLKAVERAAGADQSSTVDVHAFVRVARLVEKQLQKGTHYKRLTIHRYRPRAELGGALGMLNFDRDVIRASIEQGFQDAARHDCESSHCVLP